jgi:hypothetical protein
MADLLQRMLVITPDTLPEEVTRVSASEGLTRAKEA